MEETGWGYKERGHLEVVQRDNGSIYGTTNGWFRHLASCRVDEPLPPRMSEYLSFEGWTNNQFVFSLCV